jgi:hypothetical protein
MSIFSKAFGASYDKNKLSMLTRNITIGNQTLKVRVPYVWELESIYNADKNVNAEKVEQAYQMLLKQDLTGETVETTDDDTIVSGRSLRDAATKKIIMQYRITQYFKLLVPEVEGALDNLEYEDIEAEYPVTIQLEIVDRIIEVISPDYKEARGKQ